MSKHRIFFTIFMILVTVSGNESEDYSSGKYEYMQIFRNIPRLFEYFLSRLGENPEVLENDDIKVFVQSADNHDTVKRDAQCSILDRLVSHKCEVNDVTASSPKETEKTIEKNVINKKSDTQNTKDGIQKIKYLVEDVDSEYKAKECLNKDVKNCNVKRDVINRSYEFNANIETPSKKYNVSYGKSRGIEKPGIKVRNDKPNNDNDLRKNQVETDNNNKTPKKYERRSPIVNFKAFSFSPEELEDKILIAEQLLEEHHENQTKKVK